MKQHPSWRLALSLLGILLLTGLLCAATPATDGLKPGAVLHGFKLLQVRDLPELQAEGYYFEHVKSGAHLFKLKNSDDNKLFSIAFRTPPNSDCGTPHILEHSVLNGSRKYPVKSPFEVLSQGSLITFLNAFTGSDVTFYPVSSRNEKEFFNAMDIYLDAALFPRIYSEPRIFQQEGWHHELNSKDEAITYKGVVYNEMKGAYSDPFREVDYQRNRALLPDTPYRFSSGGYPAAIPTLTYEQFLNFHKTYYHPSNSLVFLYGNGDLDRELAFVDSNYLSQFSKTSINSAIALQKPFASMKEFTGEYAVGSDEKLEDNTFLSLSWVAGESCTRDLSMALDILSDVLVNKPSAPIRLALQKAGIGKDVSASHEELRQNVFSIIVQNANESQRAEFLKIVRETLQKVAKEGLDKKMLAGILNRTEFALREGNNGSGFPPGVQQEMQALNGWLYEGDPFLTLSFEKPLQTLKNALNTRYFEDIIEKQLLGNSHSLLLVMKPNKGLENTNTRKIEENLAAFKTSAKPEQIERLVADTQSLKKYQETPDTPESLKKIPMLGLQDVNPKAEIRIASRREMGGCPVIVYPTDTRGVVYSRFMFDATSLPADLIPYASLLSALLGDLNTEKHSFGDLGNEVNLATGGVSYGLQSYIQNQNRNTFKPFFEMKVKLLRDKSDRMVELAKEILTQTRFQDPQRLKEVLTQLDAGQQNSLRSDGMRIAMSRLASYRTLEGNFSEQAGGLTFARFVNKLVQNFDAQAPEIMARLKQTSDLLFTQENLTVTLITSEADCEPVGGKLVALKAALPSRAPSPQTWKAEPQAGNEGLLSSSKVQYVIQGCDYKALGYPYTGRMSVMSQVLSSDYLQRTIRVMGGAYGGFCIVDRNGALVFASYRDPNLRETLDNYGKAVSFLKDFQADDRTMTRFILGTVSGLDTPLRPNQKGSVAIANLLENVTAEQIQKERSEVLSTTVEDIRGLSSLVSDMLTQKCYCTYGNEQKINENKDLFKTLVKISE